MSNNNGDRSKSFKSRWGFILASVGSAVGMANVWGFPNKLGSNGGGAFLLVYLFFIVIFSYVGLPAEFAVGRRAGTGTLGAYQSAWATRASTGRISLHCHRVCDHYCLYFKGICGFRVRKPDDRGHSDLV